MKRFNKIIAVTLTAFVVAMGVTSCASSNRNNDSDSVQKTSTDSNEVNPDSILADSNGVILDDAASIDLNGVNPDGTASINSNGVNLDGTAPTTQKAEDVKTYTSANYGSTQVESYARQVAAIVNSERASNGLSPLKYSSKLSEAALVRAEEIQSVFSHTRPNGSQCFTAIKEVGISYTTAGENIAYGQRTPEAVMNSWMNSSGHRANILGKNYEYIGIGVTYKNGIYYWVQFFAASNNLTGEIITTNNATTATSKTTAEETTTTTTTKSAELTEN